MQRRTISGHQLAKIFVANRQIERQTHIHSVTFFNDHSDILINRRTYQSLREAIPQNMHTPVLLGATIGAVTGLSAANALTAGVGGKHFISLVLSTFTAIIYYIEFSHVLNPPTERSKF